MLILPWNLAEELVPLIRALHQRLAPSARQPRIVTAVPELRDHV